MFTINKKQMYLPYSTGSPSEIMLQLTSTYVIHTLDLSFTGQIRVPLQISQTKSLYNARMSAQKEINPYII